MGISLVLFKRSCFNSKKIKKSFYLNLLNLSRKDFAMQKSSLKFYSFFQRKSLKKKTIRPWIRIYFLNQEIQYQIYKNHRFSNQNHAIFEKIAKISLFGELNIIYFILNKFFMKLRNSSTLKKESRKTKTTSNFFSNERFFNKNLAKSSFNKNLFFLDINLFKYWFFYFFNKKNKNVDLDQTFIKSLKEFSSQEVFYRSSSSLLSYKKIKTLSRIQFLKKNSHRLFNNNFNNSYKFTFFKQMKYEYGKSTFVNSQLIKKSSFLIKKLFYKIYFFNFLQAYFKTQSYFKMMTLDNNEKSILSFYDKNSESYKFKTLKFNSNSLFLKKIAKLNFELTKKKNLLKQNVSLFINLIKLLKCLSFEPKFLLYLRCGKKNLTNEVYLETKLQKQVKSKRQLLQSFSLLNSNFLKIGTKYFNSKTMSLLKSYCREKTRIQKFISKDKNKNLGNFSPQKLQTLKNLREFLTDSKNAKNINNLFPNFTESLSLNRKKNYYFFKLTFYKLFLEIHENLYFLRQSKNYFLLKALTFKFDSILKNYLLSKRTFHMIETINHDFFSNFELLKNYKNLKKFIFDFYQPKREKLKKPNLLYLKKKNFKFILLENFRKLTDLSVLLILTHFSKKNLLKLKRKFLQKFLKKNDVLNPNYYFLWLMKFRNFRQFKLLSSSKVNHKMQQFTTCKVLKERNSIKKLLFYKKFISLIILNFTKILKENRIYYSTFSRYGLLKILLQDNSFYEKQNHFIQIKIVNFFYKKIIFFKQQLIVNSQKKIKISDMEDNFRTNKFRYNNENLYNLIFLIWEFEKKEIIRNSIKSLKLINLFVMHQKENFKSINFNFLNIDFDQSQYQLFLKKIESNLIIDRYKIFRNPIKKNKSIVFSKVINLKKLSFLDTFLNNVILRIVKIQRVQLANQLNQSFFSYGQNFLFFATNSNFLEKNKTNFFKILNNSNLNIKKTNFFYTSSNMGKDFFSPNYPSSFKSLNSFVKQDNSTNLSENMKSLPGFIFYGFYMIQKFKTKRFLNSNKSNIFKFRKKENSNTLVISFLDFKYNLFLFENSLPEFFTKKNIPFSKSFKKNDKFGFFELFLLPSTLNLRNHANQMKTLILKSQGKSQVSLIKKLAPIITKWSCYYQFESESQFICNLEAMKITLKNLNFLLIKRLWKWSFKRHNKMSTLWIRNKYFFSMNNQKGLFSTKVVCPINKMYKKPLISKLGESKFRPYKNKKNQNSINFSKIKLVFIVLPNYC